MKAKFACSAIAMAWLLASGPVSAAVADFGSCGAGFLGNAQAQGINAQRVEQFMADVIPDPSVLPLLDAQPEFSTPLWDYLSGLVDGERVSDGQALLAQHRDLLQRISTQYGVDPVTIVAVWGVESDYGRVFGKRPLLQSLATLACNGRRQPFFRGELLALLKLLDQGDLQPTGLTGSWAGAFGHTQFMPSTYARIAVDGDGDGRRDLVASIPDALASTANYLKKAGWRTGQPWGIEVRVPAGIDVALAGRTKRKPLSYWRGLGITDMDGRALAPAGLAADTATALLMPTGTKGPAWLVFRNYDAIYSYNAAESYALAIATLADRLRGGRGIVAKWPTDDPGLDRAQRRELQQLLVAQGHDIGSVDGMIGTASRRAIQAEQQRLGWKTLDGRAGQRILQALRSPPVPPAPPAPSRFTVPGNYPALLQSPMVRNEVSMNDVQGLSTGDFRGFTAWKVETPFSTAAISVFGGQLLSFVPRGGEDVMWLSPTPQALPTPIRGGTPICWPYFSRQGQGNDVPSHGFVRTVPWQLRKAQREPDGSMMLTLVPPPLDNLGLQLEMELRIGQTLEQRLITRNGGATHQVFTQALHNYFNVSDVLAVSIDGLDGLSYLDKYQSGASFQQEGSWNMHDPRDPGRSDRIYTQAGGRYVIRDAGLQRQIQVHTEGSKSVVVWNPGKDTAATMPDVGSAWRRYVCVEAANVGPDIIELAPGDRHVLTQRLSVTSL